MGDYPLLEFVEFHRKHPGEHSILAAEVRGDLILYNELAWSTLVNADNYYSTWSNSTGLSAQGTHSSSFLEYSPVAV